MFTDTEYFDAHLTNIIYSLDSTINVLTFIPELIKRLRISPVS